MKQYHREKRRARRRTGLSAWALLAAPVILYSLFMLYPIFRVFGFSLYKWDGLSDPHWAGFDNYRTLFSNPVLLSSFGHAVVLIIFYAIIPLALGMVLAALLIRAKAPGTGFFRTIVFLPQVIAMVVLAIAWRQLYAPNGLINSALRLIGLGSITRGWLGDFNTALSAVGFIGTWVSTGLVTVLLMSGMTRIPEDYYEAARIDGAGPIRQFFYITLPGIRAEIVVSLTLTIIAALKTFDLVYITTSGGPGSSTSVPSYEVYNHAFRLGEVGVASSLAVVLTLIIFLINLGVNLIGERE